MQRFVNKEEKEKISQIRAKAFGVTSFIIGCFIILGFLMVFLNFRSSAYEKYQKTLFGVLFGSIPAISFGVTSLMKKVGNKNFALFGIACGALMALSSVVVYLFAVNFSGGYYYF